MKNHLIKLICFVLLIAAVYRLSQHFGITENLSRDNIPKLKAEIGNFGAFAPLVYIGFYVLATIFFLPGLPVTMLSGLVFGPFWGVVYASIGSVIGISCAFLIARYAARGMVERWVDRNAQFRRIDEGVRRQGWRMLMITRLLPIFPFNLQNYAYGLTKIGFVTFVLVSWVCMLPGTAAYVQLGAAVNVGEGNIKKTLLYLAGAALCVVLVSLIPSVIRKRQSMP
ncbi:MAG: TVP38/TMEM64 family protein [Candidatus Poribacteria bacterium]|nr:TVP38/TMEM64 family protein [Candidatus Poribacteria bacterium]